MYAVVFLLGAIVGAAFMVALAIAANPEELLNGMHDGCKCRRD